MDSNPDQDMYLFGAGYGPTSTNYPGQSFDDFLPATPASQDTAVRSSPFLNPNDLSVKQEPDSTPISRVPAQLQKRRSPAASDSSSQGSSFGSPRLHQRDLSLISTASSTLLGGQNGNWGTGINGLTMPSGDDLFASTDMLGHTAVRHSDFEASNQQMASDFDFETAASTPSGFDSAASAPPKTLSATLPVKASSSFKDSMQTESASSKSSGNQAQFYLDGSRDSSPLNAMLPAQGYSPWTKHSPSSGLEETFNGITMNGDSPGNATFSPSLQFSTNGFNFEADSTATPSSLTKGVSSPPSTVNSSEKPPHLTIYPTSLKSRVETQIPIKMTLSPLPVGVTKLRLPSHTVSKLKFLAKPEAERSPEILELYTSLVCTSAMQDPAKLDRAFARARGEEVGPLARPSPASSSASQTSKDDDEKPLNGGVVKICSGCIQRERKRASRKKQKKPDEEEIFQKDEERRVIVFNTNEIKEWIEPSRDGQGSALGQPNISPPSLPPGAMQVELPMRIACYCRHQNEKLGFQVIFTIRDCTDKVVAQAMTNSIMITDDHKTHNGPPAVSTPPAAVPLPPQVPGAHVFSTSGLNDCNGVTSGAKTYKQSFSTTDLYGLQHNFNPSFPMAAPNSPFAVPSVVSSNTSATLTPRNLSRPASPSAASGPTTKRRKQSGSGKLPSNLTMTRLETSHTPGGSATMPNSAISSPLGPQMTSYMSPSDRGFAMPAARQPHYGTSPPTPNSNDHGFVTTVNASFSLENLPRQAEISAPSSRQPSRPSSPGRNRNGIGAADPNLGQAVSNQIFGGQSRRPPPLIHKLVPAEGSITGGTEVTLLGNGFYQGLEVMFGETEATTTTFWGEKCLNCIAPPALQPGSVAVLFKHEHHHYATMPQQSQARHTVFTYVDDREVEMYRLALKTLGKQMQHPTEDPFSAAQQLLGGPSASFWPPQGGYNGGGGHQRQFTGFEAAQIDTLDLESNMVAFLDLMDRRGVSPRSHLDARRPSGLTLLHLASSLGLTRVVAALLSRGARTDAFDNNGNTAMHHAAMNGHTHIIHRLRLAGAESKARNFRDFTPADLATSLLTHQAVVVPQHHYHSRSAGGTPMRLQSRNTSSTSLRSCWDSISANHAYSDDSDDTGPEELSRLPSSSQSINSSLRRKSAQTESIRAGDGVGQSRRGSGQSSLPQGVLDTSPTTGQGPVSPAAYMMAWRDQLAAQINQFQESAHWTLPNLPTLPALPALPDYQAYPMMRRVSSIFPQRPYSRGFGAPHSKEGWWETLTGSVSSPAPPSYYELYPTQEANENMSVKKASATRAAAGAVIAQHSESYYGGAEQELRLARGSSNSPKPEAPQLLEPLAIHLSFRRDRKLFFLWVRPGVTITLLDLS